MCVFTYIYIWFIYVHTFMYDDTSGIYWVTTKLVLETLRAKVQFTGLQLLWWFYSWRRYPMVSTQERTWKKTLKPIHFSEMLHRMGTGWAVFQESFTGWNQLDWRLEHDLFTHCHDCQRPSLQGGSPGLVDVSCIYKTTNTNSHRTAFLPPRRSGFKHSAWGFI